MGIICIASIYDDKEKKIGYRLLDIDNKKVKDVPINSFIQGLKSGVNIDNVVIKDGEIKFTEGSESRYTKIVVGKDIPKNSSIYILKRDKNGEIFEFCDCMGRIRRLDNITLINYGNKWGLANAKIVEKDGKEYISAIKTPFEVVESLKEKRFIVLSYVGKKNALADCRTLTFYDTVTGKAMSKNTMFKFRQKTEKLALYESISIENGKYKSFYDDVYPILFNEVIEDNKNCSYSNPRRILLRHIIKNDGKIYFETITMYGRDKRIYSLYDVLHILEEQSKSDTKELLGRYGTTDKGKLRIITATGYVDCDMKELENSREKFVKYDKADKKMRLVGSNTLEVDNLGCIKKINVDELVKKNCKLYVIPNVYSNIELDAISYGNETIKLIIPSTITKILSKYYSDYSIQRIKSWKYVEVHTRAFVDTLTKKTLSQFIKDYRDRYINTQRGTIDLRVDIDEMEYLKIILATDGRVINNNQLDGDKIIDCIENTFMRKVNKLKDTVSNTIKEHKNSIRINSSDIGRLLNYDTVELAANKDEVSLSCGVKISEFSIVSNSYNNKLYGKINGIKSVIMVVKCIKDSMELNIKNIRFNKYSFNKLDELIQKLVDENSRLVDEVIEYYRNYSLTYDDEIDFLVEKLDNRTKTKINHIRMSEIKFLKVGDNYYNLVGIIIKVRNQDGEMIRLTNNIAFWDSNFDALNSLMLRSNRLLYVNKEMSKFIRNYNSINRLTEEEYINYCRKYSLV